MLKPKLSQFAIIETAESSVDRANLTQGLFSATKHMSCSFAQKGFPYSPLLKGGKIKVTLGILLRLKSIIYGCMQQQ